MLFTLRCGALAVAFCSSITFACATEIYMANLDGATAAPQSGSSAIGVVSAKFENASRTLSWRVSYSGMSASPSALVIRVAAPGARSGIVVPIRAAAGEPITGSARLTEVEAAALARGRVYFGLRASSPGGGEIGGEMAMIETDGSRIAGPDPATASFEARRPETDSPRQ